MKFGSEEYWLDQVSTDISLLPDAVKNLPSVKIWCLYIDNLSSLDPKSLELEFRKGIDETSWHIDASDLFWDKYQHFLETNYPNELNERFLQRLGVPHLNFEKTLAQYADFVKQSGMDYENCLSAASEIVDSTRKIIFDREIWEQKAAKSADETQIPVLIQYLEWELKQRTPNCSFDFARGIFERLTMRMPACEELWLKYIRYIWVDRIPKSKIKSMRDTRQAERLVDRGLFSLPKSSALHATRMRMFSSMEMAIEYFGQCEEAGVKSEELEMQLLFSVKELFKEHGIDSETLHQVFEKHIHSISGLIYACEMVRELDSAFAEDLLTTTAARYGTESLFWQEALLINRRLAYRLYGNMKLKNSFSVDMMEQRLIAETYASGSSQEIEKALSAKLILPSNSSRQKRTLELDTSQVSVTKQKRHSGRDREHSSIIVDGDITTEELQALLYPLSVVSIANENPRVVELGTKGEKQLALVKVNSSSKAGLQAHDAENTTLWVNNFPRDWRDSDLHNVFSAYGKVLSLRKPETGLHKRFCYVQYSSSLEGAAAIRALNNKNGLQVKFSNPSEKENCKGVVKEGREVFVRGLPFQVSKEECETTLRQLCNPIQVRIPPGRKGQANNGLAFLDFSSSPDAHAAIEKLNGSLVSGRPISAVIADRRKPNHHAKESPDCTIVVKGFGDATSSLVSLFREFGTFNMKSKDGDAHVIFSKIQEAGKAILALNGTEIDGKVLSMHNLGEQKLRPRNV